MPPCMITDPDMSVLKGMITLPDTITVHGKALLMMPIVMDHMTIAAIML